MDQATLKELLHYDPDTGVFTRKVSKGKAKAGAEAGYLNSDGYREVKVCGRPFKAHRLAFLYMTGMWPDYQVDHLNGNRLDNRWCNLRDADAVTNNENKTKALPNNQSGLLGVHKHRSKWRAQIRTNRKLKHLGSFDTPEEAYAAYLKAKRQLHEGCTI